MYVWQERIKQYFDQIAEHVPDWEECIQMIEKIPESPELLEYLEQLIPRLARMRRDFNWITYNKNTKCYTIHNYDYKMWKYWKERNPNLMVITPSTIQIHIDELTPEEQDQFRKRLC